MIEITLLFHDTVDKFSNKSATHKSLQKKVAKDIEDYLRHWNCHDGFFYIKEAKVRVK